MKLKNIYNRNLLICFIITKKTEDSVRARVGRCARRNTSSVLGGIRLNGLSLSQAIVGSTLRVLVENFRGIHLGTRCL